MTLPYSSTGEFIGLVGQTHSGLFAPGAFGVEAEEVPDETKLIKKQLVPGYDQIISDAWKVEEAGYPNLAQLALAEDEIILCMDGDGR